MTLRKVQPTNLCNVIGVFAVDETKILIDFYDSHYEILGCWQLKPGNRIILGERKPRTCRFCGKASPEVSFQLDAHAIPESLGNKSIFSLYECDSCNTFFGSSIENDLGNWSKPLRTLQRIRGKNGVPKLKSHNGSWRIECDGDRQLQVTHDRGDPVFTVFEDERRIEFLLNRAPHIPMAVLKAFVKIGLSLMPDVEMQNFSDALHWIRNPIHNEEFKLIAPLSRTFVPGPMALDFMSAAILRRRHSNTNIPYSFLILLTGNELYQVMLPSPTLDPAPESSHLSMPPFPPPRTEYGPTQRDSLDLRGLEQVADEQISVSMVFEKVVGVPICPQSV